MIIYKSIGISLLIVYKVKPNFCSIMQIYKYILTGYRNIFYYLRVFHLLTNIMRYEFD